MASHGLPQATPTIIKPLGYKSKPSRKISYLLEFVETPTFWCPHVDPTACTNFSPRTVERRPPETRKIFLFPFLLSPFPSFSLYEFFSFCSFFPLFSFLFAFLFFFSFLISFSFHFLFIFSSPLVLFSSFLEHTTHPIKGGNFLPFSSTHLCGYQIFHIFLEPSL